MGVKKQGTMMVYDLSAIVNEKLGFSLDWRVC